METQYKIIFLQKGLEMLSDYQFRTVKSLLATPLRLTPKMQEDYDRIQITNRTFSRFSGIKCVLMLIEAIKGNRELEGLVKSLQRQVREVSRRLAAGAAAAPKRKKQMDSMGPSAPACSSSGPGETQGATEAPRAQKRKKCAQEQSEPQRNTAYCVPEHPLLVAGAEPCALGNPLSPASAPGIQPCATGNPLSPASAPDVSSAASTQVKKSRRSQSSTLPETSAANLTPTPVETPRKPLSTSGQTEGPCPAAQVAGAFLDAALLHHPPPPPAAATSSSSTPLPPAAPHAPAQSSASAQAPHPTRPSSSQRPSSTQVPHPGAPLSARSTTSTQLPHPGPSSSAESAAFTQVPHPGPTSSAQRSSSTQVPSPGVPSPCRSTTSTQLQHTGPPSSVGSTSAQLPSPGAPSSAGSVTCTQLLHPGCPPSVKSTTSAQLLCPGPRSSARSVSSTQLLRPGPPSSAGSIFIQLPHSGPPSSVGSTTLAQVLCPGPPSSAGSTNLVKVPHPGTPSSARSTTSAQVPHPCPSSSAGSATFTQVPRLGTHPSVKSTTLAQLLCPGPHSAAGSVSSTQLLCPGPPSSARSKNLVKVPRPGPPSSARSTTSAQCATRFVSTFEEEGPQDQRKEMHVLDVTEPFTYREDGRMFHAIVAIKNQAQDQIIRVKVFHEDFKTQFVLGNIVVLSNYVGHRGFLEVYKCTSVEKVGYKQVPKVLINMVTETPKISHLRQEAPRTIVNGVFLVTKKTVQNSCVYYEIQDDTGTMQVMVYGRLTGIPCESGNRIRLICFERGEEQHQIRSLMHSFLKVTRTGAAQAPPPHALCSP